MPKFEIFFELTPDALVLASVALIKYRACDRADFYSANERKAYLKSNNLSVPTNGILITKDQETCVEIAGATGSQIFRNTLEYCNILESSLYDFVERAKNSEEGLTTLPSKLNDTPNLADLTPFLLYSTPKRSVDLLHELLSSYEESQYFGWSLP